jgi:hypothetical protein
MIKPFDLAHLGTRPEPQAAGSRKATRLARRVSNRWHRQAPKRSLEATTTKLPDHNLPRHDES